MRQSAVAKLLELSLILYLSTAPRHQWGWKLDAIKFEVGIRSCHFRAASFSHACPRTSRLGLSSAAGKHDKLSIQFPDQYFHTEKVKLNVHCCKSFLSRRRHAIRAEASSRRCNLALQMQLARQVRASPVSRQPPASTKSIELTTSISQFSAVLRADY